EFALTQAGAREQLRGHDTVFTCGMNYPSQVLLFDASADAPLADAPVQVQLHNDPWELGKNSYAAAAILGDVRATLPVLGPAVAKDPAFDPVATAKRTADIYRVAGDRRASLAVQAELLLRGDEGDAIQGVQVAVELAALQPQLNAPMILVNESL